MTSRSVPSSPPEDPRHGHPVLAAVAIVVGGVLLIGGLVMVFVRIELVRGTRLRDQALQAIDEPVVHDRLTAVISDHIRQRLPVMIPGPLLDPAIRAAVDEAIDLPAFRQAFGVAVQRARDRAVDGRSTDIALPLAQIAQFVVPYLERLDPRLAEPARTILGDDSVIITTQCGLDRVTRLIRVARILAIVLPGVALLCFALALVVSRRRADALMGIGVAVAITGAALIVISAVGRKVAGSLTTPGRSDVAEAVWSIFTDGLRSWGVVTTIAGGAILLAGLVTSVARDAPATTHAR